MFALIDCNNFYASCERVFRPDLNTRPILVLSNNDGCVIARSNETKALGIKMGEPYFKIQNLCREHHIHVFSSNYTLYGDFSERVMALIQEAWGDVEIYSIDEAFLDLSALSKQSLEDFCIKLRQRIFQCTGIPTSIGIGETKTLAKAANFVAKNKLGIPVFNISYQKHWLKQIKVNDVWGIGRQWTKKLNALNIVSAYDLASYTDISLNKSLNVSILKTILELNGQACLDLEEEIPKKSIVSSRSFGEMQTTLSALKESVSYHCGIAWAKMRKQNLLTQYVSTFIYSNHFRKDLPQYANTSGVKLTHPSDDIRVLTHHVINGLESIYKEGFFYKKSGVLLTDFTDKSFKQLDLFSEISEEATAQSDNLMNVFEKINAKYGARTIHLAAEGVNQKWSMKHANKTPSYTTKWSDIPVVYAK